MADWQPSSRDLGRLALLARAWGVDKAEALTRVLDAFEGAEPVRHPPESPEGRIPIHVVYGGQRTEALFDPLSDHVEILSGELAGRSYRTPSGAAVDIVHRSNAAVNPNRNGWSFWTVTSTGNRLGTLRRST